MSNYYLCDMCRKKIKDFGTHVLCAPHWPITEKRVMYDYNGRGGKRYDEPTDVCKDYERRDES